MKSSFITTVFNEEDNIEVFIRSIIDQSVKPDEIIVVDGGSSDRTFAILKGLAQQYKLLKVFQFKGVNIAKGRNLAIGKASGEVILVSDAGCVVDKHWVRDTLSFFPRHDVVAGSYKAVAKNNFEFFQGLLTIKTVDRPSRMSSRNVAFKKEAWVKVGGYPEKSLTGEDNRFMIELMHAGYRVKINPKRQVSWFMRPSLTKFFKQYYLYGRGDRVQGNLFKKSLKKNFVMILGFWLLMALFVLSPFITPWLTLGMVAVPFILLELYAFKLFVRTKKISALIWVPLLLLSKRLAYILGATFK